MPGENENNLWDGYVKYWRSKSVPAGNAMEKQRERELSFNGHDFPLDGGLVFEPDRCYRVNLENMNSEENPGPPLLSSFWEVDGYKRTVKRTEDGLVLCNELMKLMQERAEIEKKYADKIKGWGRKWSEIIDKSPAYGSTRDVLKGSLKEAEKLSESHVIMKDRLLNIVSANVMDWKAENYKKQLIGCKPAKTFDEEFQRAQKPWAKKLEKLNKAKKDYQNACRQHRLVVNQEADARQRTDHTPDQVKKLQDKVEKSHKEADVSREKYARLVEELNNLNGKYMEEMTIVFAKTQDFDRKRIEFFKDILHKFVETLDLSKSQIVSETYQQFHKTVDELDAASDLRWWSQNHGVDMAMVWPQFEECSGESLPDRGSKYFGDNGAVPVVIAAAAGDLHPSQDSKRQSTWDNEPSEPRAQPPPAYGFVATQGWNNAEPVHSEPNPFDDAAVEDMDNANNIVHHAPPTTSTTTYNGVKVKALYDYEGQEEDELSFKIGDVFTKVRDADDQGWCTGVKDGKAGLYPDSYAQPC